MPKLTERRYKKQKGSRVSYAVTVPIDLVRALDWKKGDDLVLSKDGDRVIMEKVKHK